MSPPGEAGAPPSQRRRIRPQPRATTGGYPPSLVHTGDNTSLGASFHFLTDRCRAVRYHDTSECSMGEGIIHAARDPPQEEQQEAPSRVQPVTLILEDRHDTLSLPDERTND